MRNPAWNDQGDVQRSIETGASLLGWFERKEITFFLVLKPFRATSIQWNDWQYASFFGAVSPLIDSLQEEQFLGPSFPWHEWKQSDWKSESRRKFRKKKTRGGVNKSQRVTCHATGNFSVWYVIDSDTDHFNHDHNFCYHQACINLVRSSVKAFVCCLSFTNG